MSMADLLTALSQAETAYSANQTAITTLVSSIETQKGVLNAKNGALYPAKTLVTNALSQADMETARSTLLQAKEAHQAAAMVLDNMERDLQRKRELEGHLGNQLARAKTAVWKEKKSELGVQILTQSDLIKQFYGAGLLSGNPMTMGQQLEELMRNTFGTEPGADIPTIQAALATEIGISV